MSKYKLFRYIPAVFMLLFITQCDFSGPSSSDPTIFSGEKEKTPSTKFVTSKNSNFYVKGSIFRFAGTNAYYLPVYEKISSKFVDKTLDAFEEAGIKVVRMWGFYDGKPQYKGDISFQPEPGVYKNLKYLDQVISKGKEHHIRFIVTLVNYWKELGGICQYNLWAGDVSSMKSCGLGKHGETMHKFMTGKKQQKWYKDYIKMLLNRKNTVTGVKYKNDPTIFSWEIINEGRNPGKGPAELRGWYQKIAEYIKSVDSNHMVSTGEEGFDYGKPSQYKLDKYSNKYVLRGSAGSSFIKNTSIPEIDYGTAHWYPGGFGWFIKKWGKNATKDENLMNAQHAWLKDHIKIAHSVDKPFVLGEYGFAGWGDKRQKTIYNDLWNYAEKNKLDGSLIWQFTINYRKCYENGGNICWPGGRKDKNLYEQFKNYIHTMTGMH